MTTIIGEGGGAEIVGEGVDMVEPGSIQVLGEGGGAEIVGEGSKISIFKDEVVENINNLL